MSSLLITTALYAGFYYNLAPFYKDIRVITSIINATILSTIGVGLFPNPSPTELNNFITGFFIYDLLVGHFSDKQNRLGFLSGYIHHGVYIALLSYIRYTNESHFIYLFLPFEIPTVILDVNKLTHSPTLDLIFGFSFFEFRIVYNLYVIYVVPIKEYKIIPIITLCLHTHWFRLWLMKRARAIKES